jgi:hypothetical protein
VIRFGGKPQIHGIPRRVPTRRRERSRGLRQRERRRLCTRTASEPHDPTNVPSRTIPTFHPSTSGPSASPCTARPAGRGAIALSTRRSTPERSRGFRETNFSLVWSSARCRTRRRSVRLRSAAAGCHRRPGRTGDRATAGAHVPIVQGTRRSSERPAGRRKRGPLCLDARFAKDRIVDVTRLVVNSAAELRAGLVLFGVDRPFSSLPRHQGRAGKEKMDRGDQGRKDRARLGTLDTGGDQRFGCCDAICR